MPLLWMAAAGAIALVGWKAWQHSLPRYKQWKQQRALAQAREFIAARDPQSAQLALEVALKTLPGNTDALRVAADMLEQVGAPQAMRLRRDVVRLRPDSAEDAAALVYSALKFRDFNAARDALSAMTPEIAEQPPALRAALAFALATDNKAIADAVFDRLKATAPEEIELRFAHAVLRLKHPNESLRATAQTEVETFAQKEPRFALRAYRELGSLALQRKDYAAARRWLELAAAAPKAAFNEQLQLANIDLLIDQKPFEPVFERLATRADDDANSAQQFIQWLLVQGRSDDAQRWFAKLPAALLAAPGMAATHADLAAAKGDFDGLLRLVEEGAWGPVPPQALKLVAAARAIDAQKRPALRRETWGLAIEAANGSLTAFRVLHRLAAVFNWDEEAESTLWAVARSYPDQTWSHQTLFNVYRARRNTTGMRDVMSVLRQADPSVARYQHDWATLSLLLEPSNTWNAPKRTIEELYQSDKTNPSFIASYAFALAMAGRKTEAAAVLSALPAEELLLPTRQPYLAYVYGAVQDSAQMTRAITAAEKGEYLPEEVALLRRAQELANQKPPPPAKAKAASGAGGKS